MKVYFFLFIILFSACKQAVKNTETNETPLIDVQLTYDIKPTNDGKISISGETNLPDETILGIRVAGTTIKYDSQSEVKVQSQQFQSAEISLNDKALLPGQYLVSVTMPVSTTQPPSVRAVIGAKGENLTGKIVRRYDDLGATIEIRKAFYLKSDNSIIITSSKGLSPK